MTETNTNLATRILEWLRAGYPSGVPKQDYVALLGLLRRKLTDTEVDDIAGELALLAAAGEVVTTDDVERLVEQATLDAPSDDDVRRVSAHLAAGGWPLADDPAWRD